MDAYVYNSHGRIHISSLMSIINLVYSYTYTKNVDLQHFIASSFYKFRIREPKLPASGVHVT